MFSSTRAAARSRLRRPRPAPLALVLVAAVIAGLAMAQGTPALSLDSFNYRVGDTLRLSASGLRPGGAYQVTLTPPDGSATQSVSQEVVAGASGGFQASWPLTAAGRWSLSVVGPDLDATLNVRVAEGIARQPAPAQQTPGQQEPAQEEPAQQEPAQQEPAQQDPAPDMPRTQEPAPQEPEQRAPTQVPAEEPPAITPGAPAAIAVALEDGEFVARATGQEIWRLAFPEGSGVSAGPLSVDDSLYLARGHHLLKVDPVSGSVLERFRLPAQVVELREAVPASGAPLSAAGGLALEVTVEYAAGQRQVVRVDESGPPAGLAFDPDPALYGWLRAEADVEDPGARLLIDPTNPWLYLAAAGGEPSRATSLLNGALAQADAFFEHAQIARALMSGSERRPDLAAQAMDASLDDFVDRGYRGTLLFDEDASAAYGFPLDAMRTALARGDMPAADFWAPWLYRLSGAAVPANERVLRQYADELRRLDRDSEANTWRQRAAEGQRFNVQATLRSAAAAVGRSGWLGVAALLVAILALLLTLSAKYWRPQSLHLRQQAARGGSVPRFARLNVVRHASFVEKFVIVLLFASVLALAGLNNWSQRAADLDASLGSGSLATPVALAALTDLADNGAAGFVTAYALHASGEQSAAAAAYQELTTDADAMNNLGVLRSDSELYRIALELRGDHPEASFNLGLAPNPSRLLEAYRPDAPQLAAPDQRRLEDATSGSYVAALASAFTDPWTTLTAEPAFGPQWLWIITVVVFALLALMSLIWLVIPRPRTSRNAPRTFVYHLLAVLFPGTGLADELWGVLLLVPWAIFGTDLLRRYFLLGSGPVIAAQVALTAIIVIYAINLIAFLVEYRSYRARMARLRLNEPEIASAYGLKVDDGARV